MKTYKVLEAHQGDKMYLPGDPETGIRIADPNAVEHLVRLGLLEEAGDAPDAPAEPITDPAELRQQVEMLMQERDDARRELSVLREEHDSTLANLTVARSEVDGVRAELDAARAEVDAGKASVVTLSADLDEARAQLTARSDVGQAVDAFDHDGDGKPGGSKPRAKTKEA